MLGHLNRKKVLRACKDSHAKCFKRQIPPRNLSEAFKIKEI